MPNNNTPIATDTKVKRIKIVEGFEKEIENGADIMAARGFMLQSAFAIGDNIICIFQRTR